MITRCCEVTTGTKVVLVRVSVELVDMVTLTVASRGSFGGSCEVA